MGDVIQQLPSLGIAGLLFVMWWYERLERTRGRDLLTEAVRTAAQTSEINDRLVDVLRANSEALTGLREELRSARLTQAEWLSRLFQRLDQLNAA